jgi:hypothetical protein
VFGKLGLIIRGGSLAIIYFAWAIGARAHGTLPVYREGPLEVCIPTTANLTTDPASKPPAKDRQNPFETATKDEKFKWRPALRQSIFFTATMHAFNMSEAGTRQSTFHGHWLNNYFQSVGELRGWDDGDTLVTTYVGHPLEGGIFGWIQVHNDPKYRTVEWGSGRDYFVSRLRALAWSAAWSTQWSIGPASEASIGNVEIHAQPGFDDLVVTPTLGIGLMMLEDIVDRYVVIGLENRTANPVAIMLARSFLSPSRSWANLIMFESPWHRDNRPGIFGANHAYRVAALKDYKEGDSPPPFGPVDPARRALLEQGEIHNFPVVPPVELMAFTRFESFLGGGSCMGGGGQGAMRFRDSLQFVSEVSGCKILNMPKNQSGDSIFYGGGLRWTPMAARRFSPYVQFLVGGRRVTQEYFDPIRRKLLRVEAKEGKLVYEPFRSQWTVEAQHNGFSFEAGGGFNFVVNRALAWRVVDVNYTNSSLPRIGLVDASQGISLTSGLVLRIGTW